MEQTTILENLKKRREELTSRIATAQREIQGLERTMEVHIARRDELDGTIKMLEAQSAPPPPKPRAPRMDLRAALIAHLAHGPQDLPALSRAVGRDPSQCSRSLGGLIDKGDVSMAAGIYRIGIANTEASP